MGWRRAKVGSAFGSMTGAHRSGRRRSELRAISHSPRRAAPRRAAPESVFWRPACQAARKNVSDPFFSRRFTHGELLDTLALKTPSLTALHSSREPRSSEPSEDFKSSDLDSRLILDVLEHGGASRHLQGFEAGSLFVHGHLRRRRSPTGEQDRSSNLLQSASQHGAFQQLHAVLFHSAQLSSARRRRGLESR